MGHDYHGQFSAEVPLKYISLKADDPDAYFARAKSYEEILNFDKAMEDYNKITVLSEFDMKARKMLKDAQTRLYELNREKDPPEITLINPLPVKDTITIGGDKAGILISGTIKEKSKIKSFTINNEAIPFTQNKGGYDFVANINVNGLNSVKIVVRDDYDNEKVISYPLLRTETDPPKITLIAPYTSEDGKVYLDSPTPTIAIQGKITDQSLIKSITVGNRTASYDPNEMNPGFSANLDVSNLNKFSVVVEDIYGNKQETEFTINREGAEIAANNLSLIHISEPTRLGM